MGREAEAYIHFAGQSGAGKILLEADAILLRGEVRGKISRAVIREFSADGDDLLVQTADHSLRATLGAVQVALWLKALAKAPPSLAQKLGLTAATTVQILGSLTDAALIAAVEGRTAPQSPLILAELPDQPSFDRALAHLQALPMPQFWGITRKGKSAFPEAALRAQMRAAGFIDSKSCAVSDLHTATRYGRKSPL